jgi:hypothetical protein
MPDASAWYTCSGGMVTSVRDAAQSWEMSETATIGCVNRNSRGGTWGRAKGTA